MRSTSSSPMLRSMAGAASSVGQSVSTSVSICLAEKPYCSKMLAAARAATRLENEIRMFAPHNARRGQILPARSRLPGEAARSLRPISRRADRLSRHDDDGDRKRGGSRPRWPPGRRRCGGSGGPSCSSRRAAALLAIAYRASARSGRPARRPPPGRRRAGCRSRPRSAPLAGGLLPELAKLVADRGRSALRGRGGEILFNTAFFAFDGVVIDLLYRGEARLFGGDAPAPHRGREGRLRSVRLHAALVGPDRAAVPLAPARLLAGRDAPGARGAGSTGRGSCRCSSPTGCSGSRWCRSSTRCRCRFSFCCSFRRSRPGA